MYFQHSLFNIKRRNSSDSDASSTKRRTPVSVILLSFWYKNSSYLLKNIYMWVCLHSGQKSHLWILLNRWRSLRVLQQHHQDVQRRLNEAQKTCEKRVQSGTRHASPQTWSLSWATKLTREWNRAHFIKCFKFAFIHWKYFKICFLVLVLLDLAAWEADCMLNIQNYLK